MSAAEKISLSFSELLALEAATGEKYEYYAGFPVCMAGGTLLHALISSNISASFFMAFAGKGCVAYSGDARVAIEEADSYVYPDVSVVCGPPETGKGHSLANPSIIVEVLSESTELYDRTDKFRLYRSIASLRQYIMVSQKNACVESYHRGDNGMWVLTEADTLDKSIGLHGLDTEIKMSDIYRNVVFPPLPEKKPLPDMV